MQICPLSKAFIYFSRIPLWWSR